MKAIAVNTPKGVIGFPLKLVARQMAAKAVDYSVYTAEQEWKEAYEYAYNSPKDCVKHLMYEIQTWDLTEALFDVPYDSAIDIDCFTALHESFEALEVDNMNWMHDPNNFKVVELATTVLTELTTLQSANINLA